MRWRTSSSPTISSWIRLALIGGDNCNNCARSMVSCAAKVRSWPRTGCGDAGAWPGNEVGVGCGFPWRQRCHRAFRRWRSSRRCRRRPPCRLLQKGLLRLRRIQHAALYPAFFLPGADHNTLWDRVRSANILCGPCIVQEVIAGDGASQGEFRFVGPKGSVAAKLTLAENKDRLLDADFRWLGVD